jgi:hypothetical protein
LQVRHTLERKKRFFVFFFSNGKLLHNELRKTKIDDVTPAKAGVQSEKLDSRFRGNDKYCFRNRN